MFLFLFNRSVYDDQPNAHQKFMEKLDACIRNHDREIEKMCNFHHQGFVDAITELLKVRADAEKLKVRNKFFRVSYIIVFESKRRNWTLLLKISLVFITCSLMFAAFFLEVNWTGFVIRAVLPDTVIYIYKAEYFIRSHSNFFNVCFQKMVLNYLAFL